MSPHRCNAESPSRNYSDVRRVLLALGLLCTLPSAAVAQGSRVLIFAPTSTGEAWAFNLRLELAVDEGSVVVADGTQADDPGADTALRLGEEAGADAVAWVESSDSGAGQVHVLVVRTGRSLAAPLATNDGRTTALVSVSLIEEAVALGELRRPGGFGVALDDPAAGQAPRAESSLDEPPEPADVPPHTRPFWGVGTSGLAYVSDVAFDAGFVLRGVLGLAVGDLFQVQGTLEAGVFRETLAQGLEIQPSIRTCPEVLLAPAVTSSIRLLGGVHTCFGVSEARTVYGGPAPDDMWWTESAHLTLAAGGFVGVEIDFFDWVSIRIRYDVDAHLYSTSTRRVEALMGLSSTLVLR